MPLASLKYMPKGIALGLAILLGLPVPAIAQQVMIRAVDQNTGMGVPGGVLMLSSEGRRLESDGAGWTRI